MNHVEITQVSTEHAGDGRWAAAKRIGSSKAFEKSPRIRELLLFVASRSIEGHAESLSEYEIGRAVFQRNDAYIPTEDSIVRSSMRQLRRKLGEYYETEGRDDPWVIEIPKGSYLATFTAREVAAPLAATSARFAWSRALWAALAASVCLNAMLLFRGATPASGPENLMGVLVQSSADPTQLVTDDYAFVLLGRMSHKTYSLEEYVGHRYKEFHGEPFKDARLNNLWDLLSTRYLVSVGAVGTVDRVLRAVPEAHKVVVRHARNLSGRDFQQGNLILYGAVPNNPWSQLFEDKMHFRIEKHEDWVVFHNLAPKPGEQETYSNHQSAHINSGPGYARLAYLPGQSGRGFVVLLSGLNMVTAEAAAEFATNPKYLPEIRKLLGTRPTDVLPHFEILLRTSAFDSTPKDVTPVAFRRLD